MTNHSFETVFNEATFLDKVEEKLRNNVALSKEELSMLEVKPGRPSSLFQSKINEILQKFPSKEEVCPLCDGSGLIHVVDSPQEEATIFFYELLLKAFEYKPSHIHLCVSNKDLFLVDESKIHPNKPVDPSDFLLSLRNVVPYMLSSVEVKSSTEDEKESNPPA